MKKYILLLTVLLSFSASYVFGYYDSDDFIDFLVHSNQFRARLNALGFKLEANNVHVTAGLRDPSGGKILNNFYTSTSAESGDYDSVFFVPKAIVGIGYKTPMIGVGLGYEFAYQNSSYQVHSPILAVNALNDNLRITVPVHIGIGAKNLENQYGVSTAIEARYYLNLPFMSHIRFYARYGEYNDNSVVGVKSKNQSLGFAARIYFRVETEEVLIEPIIRVQYDQSLLSDVNGSKFSGKHFDITAFNRGGYSTATDYKSNPVDDLGMIQKLGYKIEDPYRVGVALPVGFTAGSDAISLYLEPSLSFNLINGSRIYKSNQNSPDLGNDRTDPFYTIGYLVYGEFYIKPVKSLEWYTEIQTGGASTIGSFQKSNISEFVFNASTGITWYFNL